jgi:hypothetical protein
MVDVISFLQMSLILRFSNNLRLAPFYRPVRRRHDRDTRQSRSAIFRDEHEPGAHFPHNSDLRNSFQVYIVD